MRITFHGAARNVTGSCHLVECRDKRILIDCGLYQGNREMDEENSNDSASIPPRSTTCCSPTAILTTAAASPCCTGLVSAGRC